MLVVNLGRPTVSTHSSYDVYFSYFPILLIDFIYSKLASIPCKLNQEPHIGSSLKEVPDRLAT